MPFLFENLRMKLVENYSSAITFGPRMSHLIQHKNSLS